MLNHASTGGLLRSQLRRAQPGSRDVVEFFLRRVEAERFIAACVADVPEWEDELRIVEVELHGPDAAQPSLS